ncbi:MAG: hypothetical protein WKF37_08035, partial [Bryobacteraceae bacterium]
MDDFTWLALEARVTDTASFFDAMFTPFAQGTIRPLSERLFFMSFYRMFGLDALPFRAVAFATQFANLILLTALTRRVTGSSLAGLLAPLLWIVNANLYMPMSWTSAYNQILCAFCLLLSTYLYVRFTESGDKRFYVWQWVVFVLGFGVLELNVVYPAIAALYALCCARRYFIHTLPMFAVSIAYFVAHRTIAPQPHTGLYAMSLEPGALLSTLVIYIRSALGAEYFAGKQSLPLQYFAGAVLGTALLLLGFLIWRLFRHDS